MILWPFVSRGVVDAKHEALEAQRLFNAHLVNELAKEQERSRQVAAVADTRLAKEEARSNYLMDTIVSMRISGGTVQRLTPLADGERPAKPPRSDIDQAIDENKYASNNPALRTHQRRWAEREIARGVAATVVLEKLRSWSSISSDDEGED